MNGTPGFQEVQSSTSRSPSSRFQHEQRHRFGTDSWQLLRTHDLIPLFTGTNVKPEKVLADTVFCFQTVSKSHVLAEREDANR